MTDAPDEGSSYEWREATGEEKERVVEEIFERREQAISAGSETAGLGYELDEDGEILWWMSPGFLMGKGAWARKSDERERDESGAEQ